MIKLSIITINYNDKLGLEITVNSVISQSYKGIEYIIIDGASTDGSLDVIKSNESQIAIWESEKDQGIYDAQSKGAKKANGEYQLFLNSGDVLATNTIIEEIIPFLEGKEFYYGNLLLDKNGIIEKHKAPKQIDLDFMLNSTFWHPCVFIKSDLFKRFGYYNMDFKIAGDYEFFIRCLTKPGIETQFIDKFITLFDGDGISNNPKQIDAMNIERNKAWENNVSLIIYDALKKHLSFKRTKYANWLNKLQHIRGKEQF